MFPEVLMGAEKMSRIQAQSVTVLVAVVVAEPESRTE
jgi:hypothetical protein